MEEISKDAVEGMKRKLLRETASYMLYEECFV